MLHRTFLNEKCTFRHSNGRHVRRTYTQVIELNRPCKYAYVFMYVIEIEVGILWK